MSLWKARARGCRRARGTRRRRRTRAAPSPRRSRRRRRSRPRRRARRPRARRAPRSGSACAAAGRCSSSSACAATPIARKNAAIAQSIRSVWNCGASAAPTATYERCHARVRRVEQRHVVAPAARPQRVERGPYLFLRPHVTIPPPSESRRACTSSIPASRHAVEQPRHRPARVEARGSTGRGTRRPRASRRRSRGPRPGARRGPTAPRAAARRRAARRTRARRSSPPGRTTRASSRSVAAGSST